MILTEKIVWSSALINKKPLLIGKKYSYFLIAYRYQLAVTMFQYFQ